MISKLILGRSKKFSLFNSTKIDFGHFFVNYISKSDFDQYYLNINYFSNQITKYKSIYLKINSIKRKSNTLEVHCT